MHFLVNHLLQNGLNIEKDIKILKSCATPNWSKGSFGHLRAPKKVVGPKKVLNSNFFMQKEFWAKKNMFLPPKNVSKNILAVIFF